MLMRLVFGACLFGLGYYLGRETTRQNLNQIMADTKVGEPSPAESSGKNVETEYDETNGGGRTRG